MAPILATIARALRLDQHEAPVHFHTAGFWRDEQHAARVAARPHAVELAQTPGSAG